jgi:hypothetical protein
VVARVLLLLAQLAGVLAMQMLRSPQTKMRAGLWLLVAVAGAATHPLQSQLLLTKQDVHKMHLHLLVCLIPQVQAAVEQHVRR